tara:strand:+ start:175 stop:444 length:270 start_codon:yes stop_codon:yes gene_type:complete
MNKVFQKIFKWMPVILFSLLIMLDRENMIHVAGYIILILSYSGILILRLLHDKKEWHNVFNKEKNMGSDSSLEKLSDLKTNIGKRNKST